jgi:formylglycine-generating enzyme required for sulfatase activity
LLSENRSAELRDRYPGPRSYADDPIDEALFFGRDEEAEALLHRVRAHRTLILFGRSGLGKTSLLQAGLYTRLRKRDFFPITVRFNNPDVGPVQAVISAVEAGCADHPAVDYVPGDDADLWGFFKSTDLWRGEALLTPVLVLDQFEEVFTLRDAAFRRELAAELRDLVETGPPRAARRRRAAGAELPHGEGLPDVRLLLSLREEYLAALEELVADVPSLLEQRFRLTPMTEERARLVIVDPAARELPGVYFRTRPFSYTDGALNAVMKELSNEAGEVELIHLQILCQAVERQVAGRQDGERLEVDEGMLGGEKSLQRISSDFYRNVTRHLVWPFERFFARRLCEQGLLSPEGYRVSLEEGQARRKYHVSKTSLAKLVDSRLVRGDTRPGLKGFYYELSHDSLARSVFRQRRVWTYKIWAAAFGGLLISVGVVIDYQRLEVDTARQQADAAQDSVRAFARSTVFRDTLSDGSDGPEMVVMPAGEFQMGCVSGKDCRDDELPVRTVTFGKPFAIGKYEVTFDEYAQFTLSTGQDTPPDSDFGRDRRPVINVSWDEARKYAGWLSGQTGKRYRLLTEAEWEYAARAGTATPYWWGDGVGKNRANCAGCGSKWDGKGTAPVGSFAPNPFNLYDTAGNVWEWVQDCWHDNYDGASSDGSAWEKADGGDCGRRVIRGGSWFYRPRFLRSASRSRYYTVAGGYFLGFRLAQDL